MLHVFETYAIKKCVFCREWFCAQAYMKVGVGAPHLGIGKDETKRKEGCCVQQGELWCCG